MKKIGRNELCPCGSGKKFKKCCGFSKVTVLSSKITWQEIEEVFELFSQFIDREREKIFDILIDVIPDLMFDEDDYQPNEMFQFLLESIIFDLELEGEINLFQKFLNKHRNTLKERVLRQIEKWKDSYISYYRVEDVVKDRDDLLIIVKDIFTEKEKEVYVKYEDYDIEPGEIILARLLSFNNRYTVISEPAFFSGDIEYDIKETLSVIKNEVEIQGFPSNDWEGFLKKFSVILIKTLIEMEKDLNNINQDINPINDFYINLKIRSFLLTPQIELKGLKPIDLIYNDRNQKELKKFFKRLRNGLYDDEDIEYSRYADDIEELMEGNYHDIENILLYECEDEVYINEGLLFLNKTYGQYLPKDVETVIRMWIDYSWEKRPKIKKEGTWAAALEYHLGEAFNYHYKSSQKELADKYGVSPSTINRNNQLIEKFIAEVTSLSKKSQILFTSPLANRPITERHLALMAYISEQRNFSSHEEINLFMDKVMKEGYPQEYLKSLPKNLKGQLIIYDAWEVDSPKEKIKLAKKALKIHPQNADAYVLLAEHQAKSLEEELAFYQKGVEEGAKDLGKELFAELKGHFWRMVITRPYMRAKFGLANTYRKMGRLDEAITHFIELLELNPNDNQGVRHILVPCLVEKGDIGNARKWLQKYNRDSRVEALYNDALVRFFEQGTPRADKSLRKAIKSNTYVPYYLLGKKEIPHQLPESYLPGEEDEGIIYSYFAKSAWQKEKKALDWLQRVWKDLQD
ncbi:SEC-C metal-binding domain-containing protein [Anaerobranca gottschalkii]|uniref:ST7 protein n=1 Tax=Anaerobranca gottschalkii DSM 13577 TaxID=1120990 RepID=A0A1I0AI73_9FIRM|nr:SEC-C metal-binding domain-containing protein [Anaerobranca gottschalkii]SES93998.1 ST7 protein [Anaerobranca gottschalkii DSM 13577]